MKKKGYYVFGDNGKYEEVQDPYSKLILDIHNGKICVQEESYRDRKKLLSNVINELDGNKKKILLMYYGFEDKEYSLIDIVALLNADEEFLKEFNKLQGEDNSFNSLYEYIEFMYKKTLRMLRHPRYYRRIMNVYSHEHEECVVEWTEIIYQELKNTVLGNGIKSLFLDKILKKNKISIVVEESEFSDNIEVDEGYFKGYVICDDERINFKFKNISIDEVVDSLYEAVFDSYEKKHSFIRCKVVSAEVINLLMLRGYAFYEDLEKNREEIVAYLHNTGFDEYIDEFNIWIRDYFNKRKNILMICFDDEEYDWIVNHKFSDSKELCKAILQIENKTTRESMLRKLEEINTAQNQDNE